MSFLTCFLSSSSSKLPVLAFGKMFFVVFILASSLSVTSLCVDTEKGRKKVVHVLGKIFSVHVSLSV